MRLTCPGCKAQYEVPAEVIPAEGREVQCSNCNATWFQEPESKPEKEDPPRPKIMVRPQRPAAPAPEKAPAEAATAKTTPQAPISDTPPKAPPPKTDTAADQPGPIPPEQPAAIPQKPEDTTPDATTPTPAAAPVRRKLDPAVADVLREEAELEAKVRRNEMLGSVESQPDLGLTGRAPSAPAAPEPQAEKPPTPPSQPPTTAAPPSAPMFSEPPAPAPADDTVAGEAPQPETDAATRRSSKRGFTTVIALAAICVLIYAFAPQIAEAVPETDPWLSTYVTKVDEGRVWLDGRFQEVLAWLDANLAAQSAE